MILIQTLEIILKKVKDPKVTQIIYFIAVLGMIGPNYVKYLESGLVIARYKEHLSVEQNLKVIEKFKTAYISNWEVDMYNYLKSKKNIRSNIIAQSNANLKNIKRTDIFLIHFNDKAVTDSTNSDKFIFLGTTKTHNVFKYK